KARYNRITGFYIEVAKPNLHLVPGDYQRRSSTVGAERFIMPALAEHEARVLSAEERRAALEQQIFEELRAAVLSRSANLRACAAAVAEADALLSFARSAAASAWWTGSSPGWAPRTISPAARAPSWWRWRSAPASCTRRRRVRSCSLTKWGAGPAPSTGSRWRGPSPSTCTTWRARGPS